MFIFPRKTSAMISCRSSLDVCRRQTTIGSGEAAVVWTNNSCTRIQIKWHCELLLFCRIAVYMLSLSNQLWRYRIWRDKCNSTGLFACTWLPSYPPLAVWFILLLLSLNIANIFCNLCAHLRYKNFCCFIIRRLPHTGTENLLYCNWNETNRPFLFTWPFITHEEGRCLLLITHPQSRGSKEHT